MESWINQTRSGFIPSLRTSSRLRQFSEFFYLKTCEQSGESIVVAIIAGRDLNQMYLVSIKVLKGEIYFRELIRKK